MLKNQYYDKIEPLFEMIKCLSGREAVFLSKTKCIRCIKAHSYKYLKSNFNAFNFFTTPYNVYYSLARLRNMPMFSFNLKARKEQQKDFTENFKWFMEGYDMGIDFDNKGDFKQVYNDTKKIKAIFDEYQIPYELKFSGSGFHININNDKLPNIKYKHEFFKRMMERLATIFNCPTIDKGVYDQRRIWKAPYSYDVKTGNIALPLDNLQFENFTFSMVKPENVLSNLKVRGRGTLERVGKRNGLTEFIEEYILTEGEEIGDYI